MPELPEVETIKNGLVPHVTGRRIAGVRIHDSRPVKGMAPTDFAARLIGQQVTGLERRGKYLAFSLSGGEFLVIHLRMTGALLWNPSGDDPFTRAEFIFNNSGRLVYTDVRRFGTFNIVRDISEITGKLGIEPFSRLFKPELLSKTLKTHTAPVKSVILNQGLIAGIGNMYADEALFASWIHPQRPANSLNSGEILRLQGAIRSVLRKGIKNKGASIRNYRCPDGVQGKAHLEFCVAHREGDPCPRCGRPISRIVVGQRGTYYCSACQKPGSRGKPRREAGT
jgi:formamidopyrimidine-DNA glycosylase